MQRIASQKRRRRHGFQKTRRRQLVYDFFEISLDARWRVDQFRPFGFAEANAARWLEPSSDLERATRAKFAVGFELGCPE